MELNYEKFQHLRNNLVNTLKAKGIRNKSTLAAIGSIPREIFVTGEFADYAYEDTALPIDCSQTISQPYTVAYMTEALRIKEGDKILEIGTGSGYQAAILTEAGAKVYTIERIRELLEFAREKFNLLGYDIKTKLGDGTLGWEEEAPFDGIIVTAAAPRLPINLINQLNESGRLIIPIGDKKTQTMHLFQKQGWHEIKDEVLDQFRFVPLIGEQGWSEE